MRFIILIFSFFCVAAFAQGIEKKCKAAFVSEFCASFRDGFGIADDRRCGFCMWYRTFSEFDPEKNIDENFEKIIDLKNTASNHDLRNKIQKMYEKYKNCKIYGDYE